MSRTARVALSAPPLLWALFAFAPPAAAQEAPPDLTLRNAATIATIGALWAGYGYNKWWDDGFGGGFKTTNEGWFGTGTDSGGADKLGHMFSNYASVRLLTPLFTSTGNSREEAIRLAGWTTIGIFTGIEVLDGYSRKWGFSPQDALMNVAGTALGVFLESHPDVDDKFDFRFAYRRSRGSGFDPFGDYSGQRYLLVLKADGFETTRRIPALRYLELSVGYQARGFDPGGDRRRDLYVGVSLNLSRLLADGAYGGQMHSTPTQRAAERAFELLQFPAAVYSRTPLNR
jgi:hypothetical protein